MNMPGLFLGNQSKIDSGIAWWKLDGKMNTPVGMFIGNINQVELKVELKLKLKVIVKVELYSEDYTGNSSVK